MSLAATQRELYALITGFGGGPKAAASRRVKGTRGLSPLRRVRIYGDQYFWRMYEALTLDYPRVAAQLPEKTLQSVVRRYAQDCPSRHFDLGRFGAHFVPWFERNPVRGARADLVDLARLEWARTEAFLAPDAAPIDTAAMARVPPAQLPHARLSFVPSVRLIRCRHEVAALFEALKKDEAPPAPRAAPQALVVWRKGFIAWHAAIDRDEAKALEAAQKGKPLFEVVAHFTRRADPAKAAFAAVGSWVTEGMVAAVQP